MSKENKIIIDINAKPIMENDKFNFKLKQNDGSIDNLIGSFCWNQDCLRYEIDIWDDPKYICLFYAPEVMYDFELINKVI
jgi:hypothetical protein